MTISDLPLGYCTNVHPSENVEDLVTRLEEYLVPVARQVGTPMAAGLWLSAAMVEELCEHQSRRDLLASFLKTQGLECYTLNAFPYGNFHSDRVKEQVYLPGWDDDSRLEYTGRCARLLASCLDEQSEGSISTVPLGFKKFRRPADFEEMCILNLLTLAQMLDRQHDETGRMIRLAIEPEPLCVLETTTEAITFFERLFAVAAERGIEALARDHLGLCYDVCHQAVEYEDIPASIRSLHAAGIRLNKIHVTCAVHADRPGERPEVLAALRDFCEHRYLHQTIAPSPAANPGNVARQLDLTESFLSDVPKEFLDAESWRVHFHVPVDAESLGPLGTTRAELVTALREVRELPYAPHLEVETYTWPVMRHQGPVDLVDGLSRELIATNSLLSELRES